MTQETESFFKSMNIQTIYPHQGENSNIPYSSIFIPHVDTSQAVINLYQLRKNLTQNPEYLAKIILHDAMERNIVDLEKFQTQPEKAIIDIMTKSEGQWLTLKFPIETENNVTHVSVRAPGYSVLLESLEAFLSQGYIDKIQKELVPQENEWDTFDFETGKYISSTENTIDEDSEEKNDDDKGTNNE